MYIGLIPSLQHGNVYLTLQRHNPQRWNVGTRLSQVFFIFSLRALRFCERNNCPYKAAGLAAFFKATSRETKPCAINFCKL